VLYWIALGNPSYSLAFNGLGQNGYDAASPAGFPTPSAFIAEVLLSFIFVLVVHWSTSEKVPKGFVGISVGLCLVLIHLVGIPVTSTSVNPARSLGSAIIVSGTALTQFWLFWVAPTIGGLSSGSLENAAIINSKTTSWFSISRVFPLRLLLYKFSCVPLESLLAR
jgi:aquaporin Z